ncbi:MAG: flippase-like domain-containing protein [Cyclobacteriaceae bacterium]|nr:flippase-like domain-containing protein [Cyclobacteriaceae bacterium]
MASRIRVFVQYIIILAATVFLVWFSLRGIRVEEGDNKGDFILKTWYAANKGWLFLMLVFVMVSHALRAERWRMLLHSAGQEVSFYHAFLSLMVGYLVNLVIPRGGEVSRCYNLYKLEKTPVEVSFGTVVVERIVDLILLVVVLIFAFAVEYEKLIAFMETLPLQPILGKGKLAPIVLGIVVLLTVSGTLYWVINRNKKIKERLQKVWIGFKKGLVSVYALNNKSLFLLYSVIVWLLYFAMSYAVIQAFTETAHLGFSAVLSLFAIGTIAMAAPLPGGAGSYHVLLPAGLVFLYQLPEANAVAFTFVFHGWQTLILIVAGVIALILTSFRLRPKKGVGSGDQN